MSEIKELFQEVTATDDREAVLKSFFTHLYQCPHCSELFQGIREHFMTLPEMANLKEAFPNE